MTARRTLIQSPSAIDRTEGDINSSPLRHRYTQRLSQAARDLLDRDARAFLHQGLSTPCLDALSATAGSTITTLDNTLFLDFHGNSVHHVGHGHPRVISAVKHALDTLPFSPRRFTNHLAVELAERLGKSSPGGSLTKALFAPGGAEAISMAMKLARIATGKAGFISLWDSFHGATLDTISVGGERHFRQNLGPLLPGCEHVAPPREHDCYFGCAGSCTLRCADAIGYILKRNPDIAALIAEPIRCTNVEIPPKGYWQRIRDLCDAHGVLLIFDEIPTALGRTGKFFACEHFDVTPDLLVLGKGLGGGVFPMAAVLARPELDVASTTSLGHFTHEKSSVGAAASLAVLDIIRDEHLLERSRTLGERLASKLRALQPRFDEIASVRGVGLLVGVQLRPTPRSPSIDAFSDAVMYACFERGLSFKVSGGDVLTLTPPLTISPDDLDSAVAIIADSLEAARSCV